MKKLILLIALITFIACNENERLIYDETNDVFFKNINEKKDSMNISLLIKEDISTTGIPIQLLGKTLTTPKRFRAEVIEERSTAKEGLHYSKLPDEFLFPAGTIFYNMPIELLKGDESIKKKPVVLTLRLIGTDELGVAYENRGSIRLVISNMLREPEGVEAQGDMFEFIRLFGPYSQTKHMMIINLVGHDFWDGNYGDYGGDYGLYWERKYYNPFARKLYLMITSGEYIDENGNRMTGWNVP